jgi:hypothetical protein
MWYGLTCNGVLIAVKPFEAEPSIWDFGESILSGDYRVVEVSIVVTKACAQRA